MFRVKICGITDPSEIAAVAEFDQSAIGLNFCKTSIRYLDPKSDIAPAVSAAARSAGVLRVGVFVNNTIDQIQEVCDRVEIDVVQLHGDETVAVVEQLIGQDRKVIRAVGLPPSNLTTERIAASVRLWADAGCHLLLDAQRGGSGKTLDWNAVGKWAEEAQDIHWTLAGGLTPLNVAEAITSSGAHSVDTASGVESPRGRKSANLIRQFCQAAI